VGDGEGDGLGLGDGEGDGLELGDGLGLVGCVVRPGVGVDPPRGGEPDGLQLPGAEAEGDTVMVRPICLPGLPLPLWAAEDPGTGVDPVFSGAWLTAAGPTVAADALGAPL